MESESENLEPKISKENLPSYFPNCIKSDINEDTQLNYNKLSIKVFDVNEIFENPFLYPMEKDVLNQNISDLNSESKNSIIKYSYSNQAISIYNNNLTIANIPKKNLYNSNVLQAANYNDCYNKIKFDKQLALFEINPQTSFYAINNNNNNYNKHFDSIYKRDENPNKPNIENKQSRNIFSNETKYNSPVIERQIFNFDDFNDNVNSLSDNMKDNKFIQPKKKKFSGENLTNNIKSKIKNSSNKASLFINKDNSKIRAEENEDLKKFIESLGVELHKFICSQKGSRVMQKYLNKISPEDLNYLINYLGLNIPSLMKDLYGNYFCQKLVQICSSEQRINLLNYISSEIINIAYHNSGTHALQSLLEIINLREEEHIILKAINNNCIDMCYNCNATHVIQKTILCIAEEKREYLNNIVLNNFKSLAIDGYGICVVKKFINTNKSENIKIRIINQIFLDCLEIVQSPFGNYAIQIIFEEWGIETCKNVFGVIQQNITSLSMQKYSSNVVEKCLDLSKNELKKSLITDIMNPSKVLSFLKNKYGNFVLQKGLSYLTPSEKFFLKTFLQNKINVTSSKEKKWVNTLLKMLSE